MVRVRRCRMLEAWLELQAWVDVGRRRHSAAANTSAPHFHEAVGCDQHSVILWIIFESCIASHVSLFLFVV
jgi:hypothetical protein